MSGYDNERIFGVVGKSKRRKAASNSVSLRWKVYIWRLPLTGDRNLLEFKVGHPTSDF